MLNSSKLSGIILILFCVCAGLAAQAADTLELDVDTAIEYAFKNNLEVKSAELNLNDKRFAKDSSWNEFVPSVGAGVTLSRMNEEQDLGFPIPGYEPPSQWNLTAGVEAQLTLSMASFHNIQKTVLDYEAGLTSLTKAKSSLSRDVKKQFYGLLLLKERMKVAETTVNNARDRYNQAVIDYQNGMISEYALLKTQVYLENSKPMLLELQNAYIDAEMFFKFTLGVELSTAITLKGSMDIKTRKYDAQLLLQKYLHQRFDIIQAHEAVASLKNSIELTASVFYPSLTVGFSYDPTLNGPFENDLFDPENWSQQRGALSFTITQLLDPLLPSSQTRVALAGLNTQLSIAEQSLDLAIKNAELAITKTVRYLEKARTSIQSKEINVKVAERAYNLALESYYAGGIDLLEVKDTEQELEQARIDLLQEKYNYLAGLLDLEYECNTPLKDLESGNEN
ncbi:MAG: TolC family protein [Spirochaetales bacterium]|nr:TolC family protein [Spirochaetales bacterium]